MQAPTPVDGDELLLAIETSNPSAAPIGVDAAEHSARPGVALGFINTRPTAPPDFSDASAARVLGTEPLALAESGPAAPRDDLMPAIARLCDRFTIAPRDIRHIAVSIGPGGYTAVRLAVTTARMIAFAVNARILTAPAAWVAARRAVTRFDDARTANPHADRRHVSFAVALASKGDDTFLTTFDAAGNPSGSHAAGTLATATSMPWPEIELLIADRFLPVPIRDAAVARGISIIPPEFDPAAIIEIAPKLPTASLESLDAMYPREAEAVRKWRELGRAKSQ